jgi:dihydrofolate reductase
MGRLTFAINVTLDGCYDHREGIADDELHDYFTGLLDEVDAILFGRVNYELMESAFPAIARDPNAPRAIREWARKLEAKPKYVVSARRREFSWSNTIHVDVDSTSAEASAPRRSSAESTAGGPRSPSAEFAERAEGAPSSRGFSAALRDAARELRDKAPRGLLVSGPTLALALDRLDLIDEYRLVVHPVLAGHGPTLFNGLDRSRRLELVSTRPFESGVMAHHCRRREIVDA